MNAVASTPRASRLKAVTPVEAKPSKPKILIYGRPGVGKTYGATEFPVCYMIDAENGANLPVYTRRLTAAGGVYMGQEQGANDFDVVINEVKALATEKHPYKTLIIDSISKLFNTAILHEQVRLGSKDAYGASKKPAVQKIGSLLDWLDRLDMNVIMTAHEKEMWGNDGREGFTFDAAPKLGYDLHLVLHIQQQGSRRVAKVGKSRIETFETGDTFDWSFDQFADRYGRDVLEAAAKPMILASEEQVMQLRHLLSIVKMPDDFEERALAKAKADSWSEVEADKVGKVIEDLTKRITVKEGAAA